MGQGGKGGGRTIVYHYSVAWRALRVSICGKTLVAFERWIYGVPYSWRRFWCALAINRVGSVSRLKVAGEGDGHGGSDLQFVMWRVVVIGTSLVCARTSCREKYGSRILK